MKGLRNHGRGETPLSVLHYLRAHCERKVVPRSPVWHREILVISEEPGAFRPPRWVRGQVGFRVKGQELVVDLTHVVATLSDQVPV